MIQLPNPDSVPVGAAWVLQCPRINGFRPGGNQPVQEVLWKESGKEKVVEWSYAIITPATLNTGTDTNPAIRKWVQDVVGYSSDDAGHIVGNVLGGSGTVQWNIFPQSSHFNKGAYNHYIEDLHKKAAERGLTIYVWFKFTDFNDQTKPLRAGRFLYLTIMSDGTTIGNDLLNPK